MSNPPPEIPKRHGVGRQLVVPALLLLAAALAVWGILSRRTAEAALAREAADSAVPRVVVLEAAAGPNGSELVLPGSVEPYTGTVLHARVDGYLKRWLVDIGTRVKAGQLLAEIDSPEIDDQLRQAHADLATARADEKLARTTADRWRTLVDRGAVARQDADEKSASADSLSARRAAAAANVDRLAQMQAYKRVVAPFDAVITARHVDTGALISAGGGSGGTALFELAASDRLRVKVRVPQTDSGAIAADQEAQLRFAEHPGKIFPARVVRTADALDPQSRSLLVELELDNADGALLSGGYAEVHFALAATRRSVRLPINTLLFRSDGLQVASVGGDDTVVLKPISAGRDFGKEIEVVAGIEPGDRIIVNPPDDIVTGERVKVVPAAAVPGAAQGHAP
jgi:RND family efflux transporter MFP subunit